MWINIIFLLKSTESGREQKRAPPSTIQRPLDVATAPVPQQRPRSAGRDSAPARAQPLTYFPSQGFFSGGHSAPLGDLFLLSGSRTTLVTLLLLFVMGMGGSVWMIMLAAG